MKHNKLGSKNIGRRTALKVLGLGVTGVAGLTAGTGTAAAVHGSPMRTDYTALKLGANTLTTTDIAAWGYPTPQEDTYYTRTEITEKNGEFASVEDNPDDPEVITHVFRFDIRDQGDKRRNEAKSDPAAPLEVMWSGVYSIYGISLDIYNVKTNTWENVAHTDKEGDYFTLQGSVQSLGPYLDARDGYVYTRVEI